MRIKTFQIEITAFFSGTNLSLDYKELIFFFFFRRNEWGEERFAG